MSIQCEECGWDECGEFCRWYTCCADSRCNHFICEHAFGEDREVIWSRDPSEVGTVENWGVGCLNAGCPCEEWIQPAGASRVSVESPQTELDRCVPKETLP